MLKIRQRKILNEWWKEKKIEKKNEQEKSTNSYLQLNFLIKKKIHHASVGLLLHSPLILFNPRA